MYQRYIKKQVATALKDTPVVMVVGSHQSGKTTLAKQIMDSDSVYVTLDDVNQ